MNHFFRLIAELFTVSIIFFGLNMSLTAQNTGYWNDIPQSSIQTSGERIIKPLVFRTLTLNTAELKSILLTAPQEIKIQAKYSNVIISLPLPNGSYSRFRIVDSPVMEKELADKFPDIKTYAGQGIDDQFSNVRLDITPSGFHAMIFTATDIVFIDPYAKGDNYNYISYYKKDFRKDADNFTCEVIDNDFKGADKSPNGFEVRAQGELRTYRIAIAATGEYTTFNGGTVVSGLAAVVTSLNRVDGVYENEVSVRMILVGNNNLLIYTNASTDPYTNSNGSTMLGQNQTNLDNVIGTANYDIGHVFSTGGGGVAYLGCVCVAGSKARGVTGSFQPIGDPFDIDYVAHEMGHQYGGNHSFNCTAGSCGGGNRVASAAYEPGSGSTIMAYAGICGAGDLQPHSDPYFHAKNLDEIINYTTGGSGNTCAQITATGNLNPVVTVGAGGNTIPISTPFSITGSATDANGDSIKYCWEQYDLGPAGLPNAPSGNAPIFRSFNPVVSGTRTFPKLSDLINNAQTIGEILPTYTRAMTFCLTARDNRAGGGGVGFEYITYNVTATAGPFLVTFPNTAVVLNPNSPQNVTWNVANTNTAPVNCANVNILLSTNGGQTFPTVLKTNTPNDGSEIVNFPIIDNSTARIKIAAADNIFFDISNANFTLSTVTGISGNQTEPYTFKLSQNFPNPFNPATMINFTIPKMGRVTLKVYNIKGELVASLINNELRTEGNYSVQFDGSPLSSGMYFYKLESGNLIETRRMVLVK